MARMNYRNKRPFWYALYDRTVEEYGQGTGYQTGAYAAYGPPVKAYGNISAAKGEIMARQFGDIEDYDRVIVTGDRDTPIDEHAVLWIDREPILDIDGSLKTDESGNSLTPWDYTVRRVGRGLPNGSAVIAVKKVNVS